jgi:hypothetical protein
MAANEKQVAQRAHAEVTAAGVALQRCSLLFSLIEQLLPASTDADRALQLAQIGREQAMKAGVRAEDEADYFHKVM